MKPSQPTPAPGPAAGGVVVLSVEGLSRSFRGVEVVERFDMTLTEGERVALHGPNGAGKSTILRCLSGTLMPTSGSVKITGHEAGSFAAQLHTGPSLSQERSFYRRLTGLENLLFFARLRHVSKRAALEQISELQTELDLDEILRQRVDRCSTGMVQRLSFARALLGSPKLLLLDEPTRSLDETAIARFWDAVERRTDMAVVIATHLEEDLQHCDRMYELPT